MRSFAKTAQDDEDKWNARSRMIKMGFLLKDDKGEVVLYVVLMITLLCILVETTTAVAMP